MKSDDLYPEPIAGILIIGPKKLPEPGEVVIGYELLDHNPEKKLFVKPHPRHMNTVGWAAVIITAICFWPVSCVPCCMSFSYSRCQRPVYGRPLRSSEGLKGVSKEPAAAESSEIQEVMSKSASEPVIVV